ncbi:uncharacterized protein LOC126295222 isoform X3 [Schistocerca gregaria]|uniref:uncharacterized protein LOC126295222 isoform X2 n=1 Tax=Schistocerca gregaria TaxID=7010 RepID=UPI00211F4260|nr:uncharacterized protein LOC126295222 isoform X2 [Schistocerca gregaria]XP_049843523.1 uncharacterized protein LOC126295222 isoform X3 [Schistocerca gregaria]
MSPPTSPPTGLPPTFVPGFHDEAAVRAMRYNPLGETGLYVSHLGCGGGVLSSLYGRFTEEECIATIREAIRQGVNYIDTAPWYGQGRSEDILGKALKEVPRQAYYIGTKVGRYELDPRRMFDFSASKTRQSIEKSLKLLQLDYVDILQVHDVEFAPDPEMLINETLPVVKEAVEAGKARFIGITGYPVSALKDIVARSKDIRISTVLSYCRDTLVDSTLQEYMPFFKERGVGVISASGPSMGLLTNAGPQPWHPAPGELKEACRRAAGYCESQGVELGKLAVYHALTREGQATHIVGANCREVLRLNLRTLREGLTEAEQQVLQHVKDRFFADLKVRHWEGKELREREAILKELAEKEKLEGKS